ncbi:MAG: hypothetical protein HMLKMBBP_01776 [Planctomycetes bacterium]|nr:hypothetical protein [Planctomycetota bacterium]
MAPKKPSAGPRRDLVAEGLWIAALAGQLLLLAALVVHGPHPHYAEGFVGSVGKFAAWLVFGAFGVASFVLVALSIWLTVMRLAQKDVPSLRWRIAGVFMMTVGGCTVIRQFFPDGAVGAGGARPFGIAPSGALGEAVWSILSGPFGNFGTFLVSIVLLCVGAAFATDWLVYELTWEGAKRASGVFSFARKFFPEPALAEASGAKEAAPAKGGRRAKPDAKADAADETSAKSALLDGPAAHAAPAAGAAKPPALRFPVIEEEPRGEDSALVDDPLLEIPEELASRLAPPAPEEKAPRKPAKETVAPAANAEADADESPEPPKPVLQVKIDAPPARPKPSAPRVERPRKEGEYEFPSGQLLERPKPRNLKQLEKAIQENAETLQRTLAEFRIDGNVVAFQQGPVVTMLEVSLAPGTKVTKIHSLADDLAMALKAESVRVVAPIPGKSTVGVEIPNPVRDDVRMLSLLESEAFRNGKQAIPLLLGSAADGSPLVEDLAGMPHLLIAGSTGSGKSVCINTILLSILMTRTPDDVRLILIDPKQVELAFFANVPHLLSPVVTDMKRAAAVLEWALDKMEERYDLLRRFEVRNIASYNELGEKEILKKAKELEMDDEVVQVKLPYFVIVVDELADLMLTVGKDVETAITRLAQKSRAVGIHVILATQRPSTDVITGLIKANMPTRIAFKVASKIDSRVILDANGAEKLLGMGDMLYMPPRSSTIGRAQGTYASDREVKRVVGFLRERYTQEFSEELVNIGNAPMLDSSEKDELYDQAVRIVLAEQRGSASLLQRALAIGYTRASRLLDLMRAEGVVGAYKGSKASDVQMTLEEYEARVAAQGGPSPRSGGDDDGI